MKDMPAFPTPDEGRVWPSDGLTKRQYASIHLRVPDSGEEWLDDMIRKANLRECAEKAMQGMCGNLNAVQIADIADGVLGSAKRAAASFYVARAIQAESEKV